MNKKLKLEELGRVSVEEIKQLDKIPVCVVLDNIRSANNVGSVFRTSDAFRVGSVKLCGITQRPPHRDIQKTALGASKSVDWSYYENTLDAIHELQEQGYVIASIEQAENTVSLSKWDVKSDQKIAVVLGNEVNGVMQEVVDTSDLCVELPQFGTKHSLNVSVCSGIVLWHLLQAFNS